MKIISKGLVPSTVLRFRCTNCGTVFECDKTEATYVPDQLDGDYWRVMCPLEGCGCVASFLSESNAKKGLAWADFKKARDREWKELQKKLIEKAGRD